MLKGTVCHVHPSAGYALAALPGPIVMSSQYAGVPQMRTAKHTTQELGPA